MQKQRESQKVFLREATQQYHDSLAGSPADEYLRSRGIFPTNDRVIPFRLGYVANPLLGHERYAGKLAIPYLRWSREYGWSVVSIRFRRIDDDGPKYQTQPGDRPRLFNTNALLENSPRVAITEGEIDAITASLCGIPTVGVPGAQSWKPHFVEPFLGYLDVLVFADGDEPGMAFANTVASTLFNAKIIPMPPGEDVNSLVVSQGKSALLSRLA